MRHEGKQSLLQAGTQSRNKRWIFRKRLPGNPSAPAQGDNSSYIFRSRAETSLVVSSIKELLQTSAPTDVQGSYVLRGIKFVAGERQQIQAQRIYVNGKLSSGLHCICMKVNVSVRRDAANLLERLYSAKLIIGVHHGNKCGLLANGPAQLVRRDKTLAVNRQVGDIYTALLQSLAGIEHSFMLDRASDDVLGSSSAVPIPERSQQWLCYAKNTVVVRFRAATGENDFLRPRADQRCYLLARRFNPGASSLSEGMNRSSVAKFPRKKREHRVEHVRLDSRSGMMIQIDAIHGRAIRIDSTSPDGKPHYRTFMNGKKRAEHRPRGDPKHRWSMSLHPETEKQEWSLVARRPTSSGF